MVAPAEQIQPVCRRCRSPVEQDDLRCAICGFATPATGGAQPRAIASILRCDGCGAAVSYSAEAQAPRCGFCASVMRVQQPTDPVEQADWILPFAVSPDQAQEILRVWMKTLGFFRPSDLAGTATVQSLQPIWWAGWIVDAKALLSWAADSDAGSWRSSWAPHSGQSQLEFTRLLVPASRGLSLAECHTLTPHFNVAGASRQPQGPPGAIVEQFDVQRSAARKIIVDAIQATAAHRLQQGTIPGSHFRNVHVAVLLQALTTHRVAVPTYVLAYRYRGKLFRALVHGQDVRCVFGQAPYSIVKIVLVILGALAAVALAIAIFALAAAR